MKLIDVCELIVDCPHSTAKDEGQGIPLVRTPNIGKGRLELSGVHRVSEVVYNQRIERAVPQAGDLILAREAPVGNVALIMSGQKVCLGQRVVLIRPDKEKADPAYMTYYLLSEEVQHRLKNNANGAVVAHLNMNEIRNLVIELPEISIQKRIAAVLSSLDDKIALNNRINHNLEEQAKALYKSWFVDYEPFKNSKFVDSELGMIPEGWRVGTIYDICDVYYGAPFNSTLFNTLKKGLPLIRIRDLAKQEAGVFTEERHPKGRLTCKGDILVGMDGEFSIHIWGGEDSWINQRISRFSPKPSIGHFFLTETLRPQLKAVESSEVATTVIHIGKNDYDKFLAVIPPQSVLDSFYRVAEPLYLQYVENLSESHVLSESRDNLLPRLMSGQVTC